MLDYLQNPPIKHNLMQEFIQVDSPNYFALTPNASQKIQQDKEALNLVLKTKALKPFSFSLESFYFLLDQLSQQFKVALILSSHKMLYEASLHFKKGTFIPLIPNFEDGKIPIDKAIAEGADCFIVPYLNEDILTSNANLDEILKPYFSIWDISYALALKLPLPQNANIYLANGENLGLIRPLGIMASKDKDFYGLSVGYLELENLYAVFLQAIQTQKISHKDYALPFFENLHNLLGDDSYIFYPSVANTLALGLKGIKARSFIQSLIFDNIRLINGQDCLFGFLSPSFVLQLMGHTQERARELLSISFIDFQGDIQKLTQKLAQKYLQVKAL
ncbi:nitrogen fixation protein NifS [Helicobacter mesocricetorum]|uniref:nitrogen fixation protein NifS n=1 Tax=Helicobacter mesocricetorum TaxID=87012 RepID=UPI000CF1C3CE|nr:nitrogen fixation protein NifS [Helicobacter mesocricetorum]